MTITLTLILISSLQILAPVNRAIYIEQVEPIYIYNMEDPLLRAVGKAESSFDHLIVNKVSKARGLLQIMPDMIKEVNRICRIWHDSFPEYVELESYTWDDAFDPVKSIRMWYIAQDYHNPEYDFNLACQIWFGRGVQYDGMTWIEYSGIVKKHLYKT